MATRMSHLFGRTLRDVPAEAETTNHQLLLRAGLIIQLAAGVYSYLPLAWRTIRKIEDVIRDEMDRVGAQELQMPALQPLELWQETGRADAYGPVLFRLRDRRDRDLVLAPTHEEAVTDLFRKTTQSYRDLPLRVYQFQTKFRDEPRPRGGLIRVRQFIMKDAYSFDIDIDGFHASYDDMATAYTNIFRRCGVPVIPVQADSGAVGGKVSQEFIYLSDIGEDRIAQCPDCGYAANQERAEFSRGDPPQDPLRDTESIDTPNTTTIAALADLLHIPSAQTAKVALFIADDQPVLAVIRGDLEINELKLANTLGANNLRPMTNAELAELGIVPGYTSPIGLADTLRRQLTVIADTSIPPAPNLVAGANQTHTHLRNTNYGRDWTADTVTDIGLARQGDPCPNDCPGAITLARGIELGHIFHLGTVYTSAMHATVANDQGDQIEPVMGCYGIGVERLLAAVIEANHDDNGILWPTSIAPFDIHLVALNAQQDDIAAALAQTETDLEAAGLTVLTDDRDERPGVKFNDADLLGLPLRLTISPRNLKTDHIELKRRDQADPILIPTADLIPTVRQALQEQAHRTALPT